MYSMHKRNTCEKRGDRYRPEVNSQKYGCIEYADRSIGKLYPSASECGFADAAAASAAHNITVTMKVTQTPQR
jgi:hypothetical protein